MDRMSSWTFYEFAFYKEARLSIWKVEVEFSKGCWKIIFVAMSIWDFIASSDQVTFIVNTWDSSNLLLLYDD